MLRDGPSPSSVPPQHERIFWATRTISAGCLLLAACAAPPGNPQFAAADPSAEVIDGRLWVFATGRLADRQLDAHVRGPDGRWSIRPAILLMRDIGWIDEDGAEDHYLWAPDVVAANGRFYLYYSVGPQDPTPSRLGVAVADRPEGPYRDSGRPLLTGGDGFEAIDPMVFRDPTNGRHLLYAGGSNGARLRVFELAPDLMTIARELPVPQPPDFTEAPFMHERNGTYYLSWSRGRWNRADYSVHYATAPTPTGPWRAGGTILAGTDRYKGPGHHSFFADPATGAPMIAYHRWEGARGDGPYRGSRRVAIERIVYRADGGIEPVVMTGQ